MCFLFVFNYSKVRTGRNSWGDHEFRIQRRSKFFGFLSTLLVDILGAPLFLSTTLESLPFSEPFDRSLTLDDTASIVDLFRRFISHAKLQAIRKALPPGGHNVSEPNSPGPNPSAIVVGNVCIIKNVVKTQTATNRTYIGATDMTDYFREDCNDENYT